MPRTFQSADEALSYLSEQMAEFHAETLAFEAVAIVVLQTLIGERIATTDARSQSMRAQLAAVRFTGGDAALNADLKQRAEIKLDTICSALARPH
jgi:hypothetical protein